MDDDDSKPVWFRERMFGYGYTPSSWQGWLITAISLLLMVGTPQLATILISYFHLAAYWHFAVIALFVVYTAVFLLIIHWHRGPA
jgi:hypothetical protein